MSERTRERKWCDQPRFLHFLQSSETPHSLDTGSFVTCLVHGHLALSTKSVGCRREQHCCGRVIEVPDFLFRISCLECGQELVDPLTPALVHEDRPIADVLVDTPVSEAEITTDQHGRSDTSGGTRSFFLNVRSSDGRMYDTHKMMIDTAT